MYLACQPTNKIPFMSQRGLRFEFCLLIYTLYPVQCILSPWKTHLPAHIWWFHLMPLLSLSQTEGPLRYRTLSYLPLTSQSSMSSGVEFRLPAAWDYTGTRASSTVYLCRSRFLQLPPDSPSPLSPQDIQDRLLSLMKLAAISLHHAAENMVPVSRVCLLNLGSNLRCSLGWIFCGFD